MGTKRGVIPGTGLGMYDSSSSTGSRSTGAGTSQDSSICTSAVPTRLLPTPPNNLQKIRYKKPSVAVASGAGVGDVSRTRDEVGEAAFSAAHSVLSSGVAWEEIVVVACNEWAAR